MTDRPRAAARPVFAWLGEDPAARDLTRRAERSVALQTALASCAPLPGVVALELDAEGVLRVAAQMQRLGWPVTSLRVRPLPLGGVAPAPAALPRPPMPASALAAFADLEREAPDGPLKQALADLLRHAGRPRR